MKTKYCLTLSLLLVAQLASAQPVKVNALNFARAETDVYFSRMVKQAGGLSKFHHVRVPTPLDKQDVIRMQRDTLYSSAIFDLDAGPVTLTLPDAAGRFMSLLVVNEDHYATEVHYAPATVKLTRESTGTRYVAALIRTFMDPNDAADVKAANALQDAIAIQQTGIGTFEIPDWDKATHEKARDLLLDINRLGGTLENRFGRKDEVDTISWLLGTAAGWGGNPPAAAIYLPGYPAKADGKTAFTLALKEVPVDGFWSLTVYDEKGYMFDEACAVNNVTAKREADGSVKVHFGGDAKAANFLAIKPGWNYVLRLYRPKKEILDGTWKAPALEEVK